MLQTQLEAIFDMRAEAGIHARKRQQLEFGGCCRCRGEQCRDGGCGNKAFHEKHLPFLVLWRMTNRQRVEWKGLTRCLVCRTVAVKGPNDFFLGCGIAAADKGQARFDQPVQFRQAVKGDGRMQVVLCMVGHIPHQKPDRPTGQRRAGVGQAVGVFGAAGMLRQQDGAQDCSAIAITTTSA